MATLSETARAQRLPYVSLDHYRPEPEVIGLVPYDTAVRLEVLPLFRVDERLVTAVSGIDFLPVADYLVRLTGLDIEPVLAEPAQLRLAQQKYYVAEGRSGVELGRRASAALEKRPGEEEPRRVGSPVARLFEQLIAQALSLRASDLHLEISHGRPRLRYRVDGVLHDFEPPPADVYPALISRIKILCELDIAEKRRPQDGRTSVEHENQNIELRVSIIPHLDGEGAVVRLLGSADRFLELNQIGLDSQTLKSYRRLIHHTHGLVLVTGPTGAGKTTTLYATLAEINSPRRKILTLEDPVEYRLEGICQIPVRPNLEFTFAEGLRSVLRHDPDVILIGEIRDRESAEIAVRASLTGHLIFASLHTNDALLAVHRLLDIGVPYYKVMTSLLGVLSQRLVRKLCPECKRPADLDEPQRHAFELGTDQTVYQAVGCEACQGLGYRGRIPIYELLEVNRAVRALSEAQMLAGALEEKALEHGFVSMLERSRQLALAGQTSLEELEGIGVDERR